MREYDKSVTIAFAPDTENLVIRVSCPGNYRFSAYFCVVIIVSYSPDRLRSIGRFSIVSVINPNPRI
jgi:hypothetical protein